MAEVGGQGGRTRQRRRAALLDAHSDFHTLRHPCIRMYGNLLFNFAFKKLQECTLQKKNLSMAEEE